MTPPLSTLLISVALLIPLVASADSLEDKYFSKEPVALTASEKRALAVAQEAQHGNTKPFVGRNGQIQFVFGRQQPSVICAVLQVCDVALQAGEHVNSIQLGDTARWNVDPAISGAGSSEVQHLFIKPMDVGLQTSLVVTTDRRTYHIQLKSHRTKYMPNISFVYPEEALSKWDLIQQTKQEKHQRDTIPATGEYLGNLSFNYNITGNANWKPTRVYNDGKKTIIQMPDSIEQSEAPTLLVVRKDGGLFSDEKTVMVNYRVQNNRYIVDTVFHKAILVSGVGSDQDRVTITKGN